MTDTLVELFSDTADYDRLADPDRQFPVVVTITNSYVVWVDGIGAESSQDVADHLSMRDSTTVHEMTRYEPAVDGGIRVDAIDQYNHWVLDDGYNDLFGPWIPGEPQSYSWRSWGPDHVRHIEDDIAAAMAKGLPTREAVAE